MALKTGQKAPSFDLKDKNGKNHTLKDLMGEYTVIFFYPKDDTPGCTIESKGFSKALNKFRKLNISVVGISGGDEKTKTKFCKKHGIKTLLLSDTDFKIAKKYSSYGDKVFMGRKYKGILRKTFILNSAQKVVKIFDKVTPESHPKEVLDYLIEKLEE